VHMGFPRFIWSSYFRLPAFALAFAAGYSASLLFPIISEWSNGELVLKVLSEAAKAEFGNVSRPEFAYALASAIVSAATGLAFAFLVLDVICLRLSLWLAGRPIARANSKQLFKEQFGSIRERLSSDPLIGHAWDEYSKTCILSARETEPISALVRPQALFNVGIARQRLFGLKLLPTIPGYFVGLGLFFSLS
jgi:hypothetical protein